MMNIQRSTKWWHVPVPVTAEEQRDVHKHVRARGMKLGMWVLQAMREKMRREAQES